MSIPGVPRNFRRGALAAFVAEVQNAPAFRNGRIIKPTSWRLWAGEAPVNAPRVDQMPCLQVRWVGGEARRSASTRPVGGAATSVTEIRPSIVLELWTKGQDQNDALDLADLIYDALAPQDAAARKAMQARLGAAGIRDWKLAREVGPPDLAAYSQASIYSVGSYQLTLFIAS